MHMAAIRAASAGTAVCDFRGPPKKAPATYMSLSEVRR